MTVAVILELQLIESNIWGSSISSFAVSAVLPSFLGIFTMRLYLGTSRPQFWARSASEIDRP